VSKTEWVMGPPGSPTIRRQWLIQADWIKLKSVQQLGQHQTYILGDRGEPDALALSPAHALQVAKSLLRDLASRPWHREGSEAAALLGTAKPNPHRRDKR
jgi:hypothetical protein